MNKQYALVATFGRLLLAAIFLVSGLGKIADLEHAASLIESPSDDAPTLAGPA